MSAVILPDGSLVFRVPEWTIHIDVSANQVHLRDPKSRDELGGAIMASAPISSIAVVQLLPENDEHAHLFLEFETGEGLDLGRIPRSEMGRRIAYSVARIARCRVATHLEATQRSIPRPELDEVKSYEEETRRVISPIGQLPTNIRREMDGDSADTMPRLGFHDEWRDEFIRSSSEITVPPDPAPEPTTIDTAKELDGPGAPLVTISAELVDSAEAAPVVRHEPAADDEEEDLDATVRIDLVAPRLAAAGI
jgi:hypothetical protein